MRMLLAPLTRFAAVLLLLLTTVAEAKVFQLATGQADLQDVSATVEVYFKSMRLNRAANQWNFDLVLRNTALTPNGAPFDARPC